MFSAMVGLNFASLNSGILSPAFKAALSLHLALEGCHPPSRSVMGPAPGMVSVCAVCRLIVESNASSSSTLKSNKGHGRIQK